MANKRGTTRVIISSIVSLIILITGTFFAYQVILCTYDYTLNIIESEAAREASMTVSKMNLQVDEQLDINQLANLLYDEGFISDINYFKLEAKLLGKDTKLIPGEYALSSNMSTSEILKRLTTSPKDETETIKFTIPEGYTIEQIAQTLESKGIVKKEEFMEAADKKNYETNYSFLKQLPANSDYVHPLEGYLFPDTYHVATDATSEEIIVMMLNRFENIISSYTAQLTNSPYTLHEIMTIASIIEQEARLEEERPMIAGVIYNRLYEQMRLQMCSTVQYSLNKRKTNLTLDDLAKDTPYNTYLYEGLPIGPICNPGEACIKAALSPSEHNYYFFVVEDAQIGNHYFSTTSEEHSAAKSRYKQNNDINFE